MKSEASKKALRGFAQVQRNASFAVILVTSGGSLIYPHLPEAFRQLVHPAAFTALCGGLATVFHRIVAKAWDFVLGPLTYQARNFLFNSMAVGKVRYWLEQGVITPEEAQWRLREIAEKDIEGTAFLPAIAVDTPLLPTKSSQVYDRIIRSEDQSGLTKNRRPALPEI